MKDRFTSREVIALTGMTPRQLPWWDEHGVVKPERNGHRRLCSMNQLTDIAVICELRRMHKVLQFLPQNWARAPRDIVGHNSEYHLLTDGKHLCLETSAKQVVDILKNSSQPILGRCLSNMVPQVRAEALSRRSNTSVTSPDRCRRAKKAS